MIDFQEALEKILKHTHRLPTTTIKLAESLGYVLTETIKAKEPIPRFDSSAVDGYAVRSEDLQNVSDKTPKLLQIIGEVKAGDTVIPILRKGYAIKIFTGACVPQNTNAIAMKEYSKEKNHTVSILSKVEKGENIRQRGEEFKPGDPVIEQGIIITPPVIGVLASLGYKKVRVRVKPCIALIIIGNELRSPGTKLRIGEIYDSNSYAIIAALRSIGINPIYIRRTKDDKRSIKLALTKAIKLSNVIISVGGVSVGEYDFVKDVLTDLGVKQVFWKVAIKPGKPNYFGVLGKKLFFGLPGNPVAAIVSFHQLVNPAIFKLMGSNIKNGILPIAKLSTNIKKKSGRLEFVRGILSTNQAGEFVVTPTKGQDSHMLGGLANANCLIYFPRDENFIKNGMSVKIELLKWNI